MDTSTLKRDVIRALSRCQLSGCEGGPLKSGLVLDVLVSSQDGAVAVLLVDRIGGPKGAPVPAAWAEIIQATVAAVPGIGPVTVEQRPAGSVPPSVAAHATSQRPVVDVGKARVIAVVSGKGGVGKSTVTANLAAALVDLGYKVGAVDADIYGFSLPTLLGASAAPGLTPDKRWIPAQASGVALLSMDFFAGPSGDAVIWRGPMLGKALKDFLVRPLWGDLDFLVLDLPPGTGDIALDVHEMLPTCQEIVVTTPDPLAARVAIRAGLMAQKTDHTVLGVVENMTSLRCPHGEELRPFGEGGGDLVARGLGVPVLSRVPLGGTVRQGTGLYAANSEPGRALRALAEMVAALPPQAATTAAEPEAASLRH